MIESFLAFLALGLVIAVYWLGKINERVKWFTWLRDGFKDLEFEYDYAANVETDTISVLLRLYDVQRKLLISHPHYDSVVSNLKETLGKDNLE